MPSTPLDVLTERRKVTSKAAEKIREDEALCTKATDEVATIQGALLEDDTVDNVRQSA